MPPEARANTSQHPIRDLGARLAARAQRLPIAQRWVMGAGFAFLGSYVLVSFSVVYGIATIFALVVALALALAAGFVLSDWWATLGLIAATVAGGFAASWVIAQTARGSAIHGLAEGGDASSTFIFFVLGALPPLILFALAGVSLGRLQGLSLRQASAPLSADEAWISLWIAAFAPVIAGGYLILQLGSVPGVLSPSPAPANGAGALFGAIYAALLATTCLLAGWLLRSWWGFIAAPAAYVAVAALACVMAGPVSAHVLAGGGFWLYIALPAVVMSAIGTALGMSRLRPAEQRPLPELPGLPA